MDVQVPSPATSATVTLTVPSSPSIPGRAGSEQRARCKNDIILLLDESEAQPTESSALLRVTAPAAASHGGARAALAQHEGKPGLRTIFQSSELIGMVVSLS